MLLRQKQRIFYAIAGHNAIFHVSKNTGAFCGFSARGLPVGLFSEKTYEETVFLWKTGMVLCFILMELRRWKIQFMGFLGQRLRNLVVSESFFDCRPAWSVVEKVQKFCNGFEQSDDLTILCICFLGMQRNYADE